MRKLFIVIGFLCLTSFSSLGQVPFFKAETGLKSDIYAYTSLQMNNAYQKLDTYSTVQFKLGSGIFMGADLATGLNESYIGFVVRLARDYSPYFNFGLQITPSFVANSQFSLTYTNLNIYMNGIITPDQKLFWISNTYWYSRNFKKSTYYQYTYLGYRFDLPYEIGLTPMLGECHSWLFDDKMDLNLGLQASYKQYSLSIWARRFIHNDYMLRIGLSAEF